MTNTAPMQSQEDPQSAVAPPAKKKNQLAWILGGCALFILISGVVVSGFLWWGYHKAKKYVSQVVENQTNPGKTTGADLWSDVPPMDGMTRSQQIDMPAGLKALGRPFLDGMMRGLNNGADAGHWDWTAFTVSGKTPSDVQTFYSSDRMANNGWKPEGGCMSMSVSLSGDQATFCAFQKQEGHKTTGLLIIAANDKEHKAASIFFMRQEAQGSTARPNSQPFAAGTPSPGNVPNVPAP